MNLKPLLLSFITTMIAGAAAAQVGYQVSLLNTATGEPRANTAVNAKVEITDSQDNIIFSGTQKATSNDFGVLQLTVGDAETFSKADTGKMPFFISVTVDGLLIGKSQILSVPVAEVANKVKSTFSIDELVGTWVFKAPDEETNFFFIFNKDMTMTYSYGDYQGEILYTDDYLYEIDGNTIYCYLTSGYDSDGKIITIRRVGTRFYFDDFGFGNKQ